MIGRLSLRARLLLGVIALAAVGLVAADLATYTALRSFLLDRVDSHAQLDPRRGSTPRSSAGRGPAAGPGPGRAGGLQAGALQLDPGRLHRASPLERDGRSNQGCIPEFGETTRRAGPEAPDDDHAARARRTRRRATRSTSSPSDAPSGGGRYRVRASIEASAPDFILLIATPLDGVDSTLHRLLLVELLVTAIVLAAMTALGLWVVRVGAPPARRDGQDRRRDRRRRSLASRRARRRPHRGRPARPRPQLDARATSRRR